MSNISSPRTSPGESSRGPEFVKTSAEDLEALDALFYRAKEYRRTEEYKSFLDFVGRFSMYSPYNNALLHVQNPGVQYTATRRQWRDRFDRAVKPNSRPYVILQPGGPVMLVYDLTQTSPLSDEGKDLPKKVTDPFEVEGSLSEHKWKQTLQNCKQERVAVREDSKLHNQHGGRIEGEKRPARQNGSCNPIYLITLNANLELESRFVALAHELAHLFLGHLGADDGAWWDGRPDTPKSQKELEAESVAYLVARRVNLHSVSERYLHWYVQAEGSDDLLPHVRIRQVLDVVKYIEEMATGGFTSAREDEDDA